MKNSIKSALAMLLITTVIAGGCTKSSTKQTYFTGDAVALGTGSMRSFIKTDNNGKPISIGFTISEASLAALPSNDTMYMLMLPMSSGGMNMNMTMPTPFDHLEIDWSAHGDSGSAIYSHPHLDCHFFMVKPADQMGIMMGMDTFSIGASYMPHNCMGDTVDEANMGMHVHDTTSSEYHGTPFEHTFMYGFYHGDMTFVETMCTKSFLDSKANYTGDISQPAMFKTTGYYPLKYTISYDANKKEYTYSLDDLTHH